MKHLNLFLFCTIRIPAFCLLILTASAGYAQSGSNDNTFNTSDSGLGNGFGANQDVLSSCIQPDGKIVLGGKFTTYNNVAENYIMRLNPDGQPDNTFLPGTGFNNYVNTTLLQSDGKILAGGAFTTYQGAAANGIIRLHTDGTADNTFNPGSGTNAAVRTAFIQNDGKIIVGGEFTAYNGAQANYITRINADGTTDISFLPGTGANGNVLTISVQADGKIIIGGDFTQYNGVGRNRIARLNADGTLDPTFDPGTGTNAAVMCSVVLSDGKILVGGSFVTYNSMSRNRITRLNTNGSPDFTFNPDFINSGANGIIASIVVQSDGQILLGGSFTNYSSVGNNRICRVSPDGFLDNTFIVLAGANNPVYTVALQSDNKIVIGGGFTQYTSTLRNRIARLEPNGILDLTLNPGSGALGTVLATAMQPDGKIIAAGDFTVYNGAARNRITRINADGGLDNTFYPGTGANNSVMAVAVQSDGKILAGGSFTQFNGAAKNYLTRLNANGSQDAAFDIGTGANNGIRSILIQSDGKILIGGDFTTYNGTSINRIARLNTDGTLDNTFNPGTGVSGTVRSLLIQPDGKIIIGGSFTSYNGTAINHLVRINADGSIDPGFSTGTGPNQGVYCLGLQNDGKIVVGGLFLSFNSVTKNRIARVHANGSLDATFVTGQGLGSVPFAMVIQEDGKIIVGGDFHDYATISREHIARINTNGSVDNSFIPGTGANDVVYAISRQTDWKIIIGGVFSSYASVGRNRIARVNVCKPTASTVSADACNTYTLNQTTYTSSGTYVQNLTNAAGCDSTLTLNLIIRNSTAHTLNANACSSYTLNGQTYTQSGTYTQQQTNAAGCDSILTLNLVLQNSAQTLTVSECQSFTLNNTTYTASGTYVQHLTNTAGCDSALTLNLVINHPTTASVTVSSCDSYVSPSGNYTWTASGIYNDTIANAAGCDSIITLDLTISYSTSGTDVQTACDSYTWINGITYTANNSTATYTFENAAGCDSLVTLNLIVNHSTSGTDVQTACYSYTWIDGITYTASNSTARDTLVNAAGCDSIVTLNLTINTVNTLTSLSGLTMTAVAGADTYQWINCAGNSIIPGATNSSYTATANGSYAVVIAANSCTDTSSCTAISTIGLDEENADGLVLLPNPTSGRFSLRFDGAALSVVITDIHGKTVYTNAALASGEQTDLSGFESGVYLVRVRTSNGMIVRRLVKN